MHSIFRNGVLYDRVNPETHAATQIAKMLAIEMPGDLFEVFDADGELFYSFRQTKGATS